jgi:hypothetical protein
MQKSGVRSLATVIVLLAIGSLRGQNATATRKVKILRFRASLSLSASARPTGVPARRTDAQPMARVTGVISPILKADTTETLSWTV